MVFSLKIALIVILGFGFMFTKDNYFLNKYINSQQKIDGFLLIALTANIKDIRQELKKYNLAIDDKRVYNLYKLQGKAEICRSKILPITGSDENIEEAKTLIGKNGIISANKEVKWHVNGESAPDNRKRINLIPIIESEFDRNVDPIKFLDNLPEQKTETTIAILDTGIYNTKKQIGEFKDRILKGFNFVENNKDLNDKFDNDLAHDPNPFFHGSEVATIAASSNFGVSHKSKVLPIKVCDDRGDCLASRVVKGLCYALGQTKDLNTLVFNLSFGGFDPILPVEEILSEAIEKGSLVAVAAGNKSQLIEDKPISGDQYYPAAYSATLKGMIAVTAAEYQKSSSGDGRWEYSDNINLRLPNGSDKSYITAPGQIYEDLNSYDKIGTSLATPLVSGALALKRSYCKESKPETIRDEILKAARYNRNYRYYDNGMLLISNKIFFCH